VSHFSDCPLCLWDPCHCMPLQWSSCGYSKFIFPFLLLISIWMVCNFCLLWIVPLLNTLVLVFWWPYIFTFLLQIHLGVKLLGHCMNSALIDATKYGLGI
jgi:hypothetical protein